MYKHDVHTSTPTSSYPSSTPLHCHHPPFPPDCRPASTTTLSTTSNASPLLHSCHNHHYHFHHHKLHLNSTPPSHHLHNNPLPHHHPSHHHLSHHRHLQPTAYTDSMSSPPSLSTLPFPTFTQSLSLSCWMLHWAGSVTTTNPGGWRSAAGGAPGDRRNSHRNTRVWSEHLGVEPCGSPCSPPGHEGCIWGTLQSMQPLCGHKSISVKLSLFTTHYLVVELTVLSRVAPDEFRSRFRG